MISTELATFDADRREARSRSGPFSYVDTGGEGRAAVFVHGVGTSAYLWRHVIARLRPDHRCIALDLPLHGRTPGSDVIEDPDFSLATVARFVADALDAVGLDRVDLVAHDTGGAVAQIFAANHPDRLHTLALTNCDTQDNIPPATFAPTVEAARAGQLAGNGANLLANLEAARGLYNFGYTDPGQPEDELLRAWLEPVLGTEARGRLFERWLTALEPRELLAVGTELAQLQVPTLIVWGTADDGFDRKWAYWLRDTIPGATEVVELDGGKLFFPDERPDELAAALRSHWSG
ncbi:alpha/beta hydrolase [Pseudonocardia eucalypti]|uniref:Alpha/beta hydrolase n=1 Tax=Pseudonocardia eucalypti TaxID=648755 RepID=A0ABP9QQ61_9PSEU|nr:pimeloyl-ACP methyl ester carboxylesterase [Pseudonocardia eucalypti]